MKLILAFLFAMALISSACGDKTESEPASPTTTGSAPLSEPGVDGPAQSLRPSEHPSGGQQPAPQQQQIKPPSFFDPDKGEISDLPGYPAGTRTNVQYGPMQGTASATIVMKTGDPIEKVAAFYDQVAKSRGWKIVDRISDPEYYKLDLAKGDAHEGLVKAGKEQPTGMTVIVISRLEKTAQPAEAKQ
jgi:hypothetical protein